jgi:LemA protein
MIGWIVLAGLLLVLLVLITYVITIYNGLVQLRNNVLRDWSNIDVLLKQRFDELPKLVKVCGG